MSKKVPFTKLLCQELPPGLMVFFLPGLELWKGEEEKETEVADPSVHEFFALSPWDGTKV